MDENIEHIIFGDVQIWLPKNDRHMVEMAKKLLDLYEIYLSGLKST